MILLVLNTVVRVFLTNPVTKRCRRSVNSFTATPVNKKEPSGCNLPGVRLLSMINMTEKVPTRVNTQTPFTNFWTAKNLHGSAFSLHATRGTVTFLSCKQYCNLWRICTFPLNGLHRYKNSSGPVAFSLCGPCKEHTEKEVSRKNNEGKGYGVRAVGTPIMVLFWQKLLPDPSSKPDSGKPFEWFILTALVNSLLPYGNAKW